MKKVLKYSSLLVIILCIMFSLNIKAYAKEYCGPINGITVTGNALGCNSVANATKNTKSVQFYSFYANDKGVPYITGVTSNSGSSGFNMYKDQNDNPLYCLDIFNPGSGYLYARRFIIPGGSNWSVMDTAIMTILTQGGNDATNYWAKLTALRYVVTLFNYYENLFNSKFASSFWNTLYFIN